MALADLQTDYVGQRGPLFRLALVSSLLMVLTLGVYRFWMKTRLRRYYWSAIRPGGQPLEYLGEPLEKLLGFLIAVVFLAFYIGIVNLILMFMSFSLLNSNLWAYGLVLVSLAGLIFAAGVVVFLVANLQPGSGGAVDLIELGEEMPLWIGTSLAAATYFAGFILWGVLKQVFVTLPLARHYAQTLTLTKASQLAGISQRHRDEMEHAEGFAEALDVGAAI